MLRERSESLEIFKYEVNIQESETNPNSEIVQVTGYGLTFLHVMHALDSLSLHSPPQKTFCITDLLKFTRFLSKTTFLFQ